MSYLAALGDGLRGLRIGVMAEGFGRPESDPETNAAVRDALARMQAAGAALGAPGQEQDLARDTTIAEPAFTAAA